MPVAGRSRSAGKGHGVRTVGVHHENRAARITEHIRACGSKYDLRAVRRPRRLEGVELREGLLGQVYWRATVDTDDVDVFSAGEGDLRPIGRPRRFAIVPNAERAGKVSGVQSVSVHNEDVIAVGEGDVRPVR